MTILHPLRCNSQNELQRCGDPVELQESRGVFDANGDANNPGSIKTGMDCPNCSTRLGFNKQVLRKNFACPHCQATLFVSEAYDRSLVSVSLLLAFGLLWALGIPRIASGYGCIAYSISLALGFPIAFLFLMAIVRTVPYVVPPRLVLQHNSYIITMNLTAPSTNTRVPKPDSC